MKKKIFGWIVKTGGGFMIYEYENGRLWNAHRRVSVFTDLKKAISVQRRAKKIALSNNIAYRYQVEVNK